MLFRSMMMMMMSVVSLCVTAEKRSFAQPGTTANVMEANVTNTAMMMIAASELKIVMTKACVAENIVGVTRGSVTSTGMMMIAASGKKIAIRRNFVKDKTDYVCVIGLNASRSMTTNASVSILV